MRVFTAALATETNTLAPMSTGVAAFRDRGYYPAGKHREAMSFSDGGRQIEIEVQACPAK